MKPRFKIQFLGELVWFVPLNYEAYLEAIRKDDNGYYVHASNYPLAKYYGIIHL